MVRSKRSRGRKLRTDFRRELGRNYTRFISLFLIVALGVAFYTGIRAAAPDMRKSADEYFDAQNLMDIRVVSTLGLRDADVLALSKLQSIDQVMPAMSADAYLVNGEDTPVVRFHDVPTTLNQIVLTEGRLPQNKNEIVVEENMLLNGAYQLGDEISLTLPQDSILTIDKAKIVGAARSPYYISHEREPTGLGTGSLSYYIFAHEDAFEKDYYTEIFLTVNQVDGLSSYSQAYEDEIEQVKLDIETHLTRLIAERRSDLVEEAESELLPEVDKLADARIEAAREFSDARADLNAAKVELDLAREEIDQGRATVEELESNYELLLLAGQTVEAAQLKEQIDSITLDLDAGEAELIEGIKAFEDGERELDLQMDEALFEFKNAEEKITEARNDIAAIPEGEGMVLDRSHNIGAVTYGENADRIEAISRVFPSIFFLVAALISLTSMSRMVEDERSQIGTLKALGYSNWEAFKKYFYFALLASIGGGLAGGIFGLYFFPYVILNAYNMIYQLPSFTILIYPDMILLGLLFACISTVSGVLIAALPDLRLTPAALMRPPAPKPGKRIWLESIKPIWKRMSFSYKVSLRNMFRYKKRLFMTLFGIGGCTALILTGFGLRDSINAVVSDQFVDLFHYDLSIQFDTKHESFEEAMLPSNIVSEVLKSEGIESKVLLDAYNQEVTVLAEDADLSRPLRELTFTSRVTAVIVEDITDFERLISLQTPGRGTDVELTDDGVVLSVKLADRLGVKAGDYITIDKYQGVQGSAVSSDELEVFTDTVRVQVLGITENYLGHYVYLNKAYLDKQIENLTVPYNTVYLASDAFTDFDVLNNVASSLLLEDEISQVNMVREQARQFSDSMDQLDQVIVIIIIAAGLLAILVLYNLNLINISERKREIATLKVLGFNQRELANYIYRENIFLMLIGIALGLVGGIFLHRYLITTVEVDLTRFGRVIKPMSWIYSVALTIFFSLGVNLGMYNKIQRTDMVESLKSIE